MKVFLVQPWAELLISQDQTWKVGRLDSSQDLHIIGHFGYSGTPSFQNPSIQGVV